MVNMDMIHERPLLGNIAAVSVGMIKNEILLDLNYFEDSSADVDMNIVMLEDEFVEVQGTAEGATFKRGVLDDMLDIASKGIGKLIEHQNRSLSSK
jgi:ribonuclease PH